MSISSFGEDDAGEMYVADLAGTVYWLTARPCSPRPNVGLQVVPEAGRLRVTVTARVSGNQDVNSLRSISFEAGRNALVDIGDQSGRAGAFTVPLATGTSQTTFFVRRQTAGQPMHLPLVVHDDCGAFRTFVGAGINVAL